MTVPDIQPPALITFSLPDFIALFPEFSAISAAQGQASFSLASAFVVNSAANPANRVVGLMNTLMYMATAHIAWMTLPRDANGQPAQSGQPASPLVGRISSAGEGSVNVSTEYQLGGDPGEAFWTQTKYGAMYWAATAAFRLGFYRANPTYVPSAIFPFRR